MALLAAVAVVVGAVAATASAGVKRENADFNIKFGYVTTAAHPYGLTLGQFKRIVEEKSGGRIAVQLIASYAGANDIALLNDIKTGVIDGGAVSAAVWPTANINTFIPLQLPFLVDSYELERRVINNSSGIIQRMLKQGTERAGLVGLAVFEGGMRQFVANKPIRSLADLKGLKLRSVESPHLSDGLKALGVEPTPLPLGEVFQAIKGGTVAGLEANSALVFSQRFDEAGAGHITVANLFPFPAVTIYNSDKFKALPADLQQVVRDAARDLPAYSIGTLSDTGLFPGRLCSRGVKYSQLPAAAKRDMAKAVQSVIKKYTTGKYRSLAPYVTSIQKLKLKIKGTATDVPPASCLET